MLQNLTGSAKIINIFNETDISGHGVQARVEIPPLEGEPVPPTNLCFSFKCVRGKRYLYNNNNIDNDNNNDSDNNNINIKIIIIIMMMMMIMIVITMGIL